MITAVKTIKKIKVLFMNKKILFISCLLILYSSVSFFIGPAIASEPTIKPVLRLNTEMHTAMVRQIGVDAENRYLVTGSDDKTVKLWELSSGRLLKTLRLPIGEGNEGKVYAVAISPDGKTIAAGGWTGYQWDNSFCIYLFDRESGRIIKRITGLPNVINRITYYKSGKFLAVSLGKNDGIDQNNIVSSLLSSLLGRYNGIRIYRTDDYSLIDSEYYYKDSATDSDVTQDGRLVTTSMDGGVRLYDNHRFLLAYRIPPGGKKPSGIRFSPDGLKIAVGFDDSPQVNILSGKDLHYLYSADTVDVVEGNFANVGWSPDGNFLIAGGIYLKKSDESYNIMTVRKWSLEGVGAYNDFSVGRDGIFDMLPLKNGGIVFASGEPAIGILYGSMGWLGVYLQGVPREIAKQFKLRENQGALVRDVMEGSPAEKGGFERGDVVILYNGKEVENIRHLTNMVAQTSISKVVEVKVIRDGYEKVLKVAIGELPSEEVGKDVTHEEDKNKVFFKPSTIIDFEGQQQKLLVSNDGSIIIFDNDKLRTSPALFSILDHSLNEIEDLSIFNKVKFKRILKSIKSQTNPTATEDLILSKGGGLETAITQAEDISIRDWGNKESPKLNGVIIKLQENEVSRSLAITPDKQNFILGTDWYLRLFNKIGKEIWNVPLQGSAWAVNVSGNGKFVVAALGDGTIRWYRLKDGKELLALFTHNDKKRWVIWTPSGYYDASVGGEDLIGWQINNGKESSADFFPASKFRKAFYRPDVIENILDFPNESEAVRIANMSRTNLEIEQTKKEIHIEDIKPPVVTILSPADGTLISDTVVKIKYTVSSQPGETVKDITIKAIVDGRPVATDRGITMTPKDKAFREMAVTIPEKNSEISIIAESKFSASEPATINVKWVGTKKDEFIIKPKLYVLSIGVSKYENKDFTLKFAAKDAKDFAKVMEGQKDGIYRDVVIKELTDEKATKDEILDGLDWLEKETTSKDIAMVFIAGHGVNDDNGNYYFLPVDANKEKLKRTGIVYSDVKNTLASLAGKTVLFLDTCHSGNVMGARRGGVDITGVVNDLTSAENGVVVFASSTGKQYSLEDSAWGNGAFTKAIVEGIGGKADSKGTGRITINMLDLYLSERVKEITDGRQTPTTSKPESISDFPVAIKK